MWIVSLKMSDVLQKDENHNVIKSMMIFISQKKYLHVSFTVGAASVIVVVFSLCFSSNGFDFCSDRNFNVKPSENYDYFSGSSCERWIKIWPNRKIEIENVFRQCKDLHLGLFSWNIIFSDWATTLQLFVDFWFWFSPTYCFSSTQITKLITFLHVILKKP